MESATILLTIVTFGQTLLIDCWPLWVVLIAAYAGRQVVGALGEIADRAMLVQVAPIVEESIDADVQPA